MRWGDAGNDPRVYPEQEETGQQEGRRAPILQPSDAHRAPEGSRTPSCARFPVSTLSAEAIQIFNAYNPGDESEALLKMFKD